MRGSSYRYTDSSIIGFSHTHHEYNRYGNVDARYKTAALMSGGIIILITAGGGAFGAMLREAGIKNWL